MTENEISVWWLENPAAPRLVGIATYVPGTRATSFVYEPAWIAIGLALSGDMPLGPRPIITTRGELPGAFSDAMPDRWGKRAIDATDAPRRTEDFDYLHYAGDSRFGALGFSRAGERYVPHGPGVHPRIDSLERMQELVERINQRLPLTEEQKLLVSSSKAMGGAQPKALVFDNGNEWIAKFARGQNIDTALVEHASMTLAGRCGIQVAETKAIRLAAHHVLLVRRFDRDGEARMHALSASTALMHGLSPAFPPEGEKSYSAMASVLRQVVTSGNLVAAQQREVFRRMAFNVLIENTDDHEHNHAFVRVDRGWSISPAYDVLPNTRNVPRQDMVLGDAGNEESLGNVLSRAAHFGLSREEAIEEWFRIAATVDQWSEHFAATGVTGSDIDYLRGFIDLPARRALRSRDALDLDVPIPRNKPGRTSR